MPEEWGPDRHRRGVGEQKQNIDSCRDDPARQRHGELKANPEAQRLRHGARGKLDKVRTRATVLVQDGTLTSGHFIAGPIVAACAPLIDDRGKPTSRPGVTPVEVPAIGAAAAGDVSRWPTRPRRGTSRVPRGAVEVAGARRERIAADARVAGSEIAEAA